MPLKSFLYWFADPDNTYGSCLSLRHSADGLTQVLDGADSAESSILAVYSFVGIVESIVPVAVFGDADGVYHFADIIFVVVCGNDHGIIVFSNGIYDIRLCAGGHGYSVSLSDKVFADRFR